MNTVAINKISNIKDVELINFESYPQFYNEFVDKFKDEFTIEQMEIIFNHYNFNVNASINKKPFAQVVNFLNDLQTEQFIYIFNF